MPNHFESNFARQSNDLIDACILLSFVFVSSARAQLAEVRMIGSASNPFMDNLDESLPCLMYEDDDDDADETIDYDKIRQPPRDAQSSLFSEIHSHVCTWH